VLLVLMLLALAAVMGAALLVHDTTAVAVTGDASTLPASSTSGLPSAWRSGSSGCACASVAARRAR